MVRSHTQELLSGPRRRSACDRCHAQKLRCLKSQQSDVCVRCLKFDSSCVFSVRTTRRIRTKDSTNTSSNLNPTKAVSQSDQRTITTPDTSYSTIIGQDWMRPSVLLQEMPHDIPNCDIFHAGSLGNSSFFPNQQVNQATSSPSDALVSGSPFDLADLNNKLVDHHANLLSILQMAPPSAFGPKAIAIDQTFKLTRQFIDTVKRFTVPSADQATIFLFLSCYYRLVDIYEGVFEKMRLCAQNPHAIIPRGITLNMPVTQVGSYVATDLWKTIEAVEAPMTAYSTHFMLLLLLCTNLCEELRDAIAGACAQAPGGNVVWEFGSTASEQHSLHGNVCMLEWSGNKDRFNESVENAMWNRWTELALQIQTTKQAAMVFAIACL